MLSEEVEAVFAVYGADNMRVGTVTAFDEVEAIELADMSYPGNSGVAYLHEILNPGY